MRRVAVATASGLLGLALVGCGAGQDAATAHDRPSVPGTNVTEAGISVRNAVIEFSPEGYEQGSSAPVRMALVNQTDTQVQLVDATSPVAQTVTVVAAETIVVSAPDPEEPGPAAPLPEEPAAQADVVLDPNGFLDATFELGGLAEEIGLAATVPLELTFDNGTVITLVLSPETPTQSQQRGEPLDVGHH